ncbi:hypothetical protein ONE63_010273 [Megalurothrips usitatus]|uniref:Uncharacterized protein n=1 Tax=Megalurothrips usitatus TaxID=439358 RepID=A0AAV7XI83_9NEOP|nr:hypothetical protein ONE63_010273 [Megalurothrips usitatus]
MGAHHGHGPAPLPFPPHPYMYPYMFGAPLYSLDGKYGLGLVSSGPGLASRIVFTTVFGG